MRLCAASRPVSILPLSSSRSPGFQRCTTSRRQRVEIDPDRRAVGLPVDVGPFVELGRLEIGRPRAVEREMRVARRRAVRDHRHRLGRGMGRPVEDLDVEDGRQPAEPLRADAERVDLVEDLDAQRLDIGLRPARALSCAMSIGSIRLCLASIIALLRGAADADPEHPRRAPAGAHLRHHLEHPVDDRCRSGSSS